MVLDIDKLIETYNMNINGVIHIGAHYGQEYKKFCSLGVTEFLMFEPHPDSFNKLKKHIGNDDNVILENIALGRVKKDGCKMYVETANRGMSSSLMKPKRHLELYPGITFPTTIEVNQTSLDVYFDETDLDIGKYNMINIDVQGYELEVFKGAITSLQEIDYIMTEVNIDELYEGCPMVEELDDFLGEFGFKRVAERIIHSKKWGDAFYIKEIKN